MRRARIGLSVSVHAVSAVAIRGRAIVWADRVEIADSDGRGAAVSELLSRWPGVKGARVVAAISTRLARVKQLHGLDHVVSDDLAFRAVRENPERFFLSSACGVAVSHVVRAGSKWYAAAFAADVVATVSDGCAAAGAALEQTVPAHSMLPAAVANGALDDLPREYAAYADAYAAGSRVKQMLALPSAASDARQARVRRALRGVLFGTVAIAAAANVLAPTVSAELSGRRLRAELTSARDSLRPVVAAMGDLVQTSAALAAIEQFRESRGSALRLFESLAANLPESTAVLSIRMDTVNATIVMVTRAGPGVLQAFAGVDALNNPQVLGAFSREEVNGLPFERVAVRARLAIGKTRERRAPR